MHMCTFNICFCLLCQLGLSTVPRKCRIYGYCNTVPVTVSALIYPLGYRNWLTGSWHLSGTILIWLYMAIIWWYQILVRFNLKIKFSYTHMQNDAEVKISRIFLAKETQIYVEIRQHISICGNCWSLPKSRTCSKCSTLTQPLGFSFVSLWCLQDYQSIKHPHYIPEHYMDFCGEPTNCCTQFHFGGQGALHPAAEVHIWCMPYTVNCPCWRYTACAYSFSLTFD